jgi:hypothetical protein
MIYLEEAEVHLEMDEGTICSFEEKIKVSLVV